MTFKFTDTASLGDNLAAFADELVKLDETLGPELAAQLNSLAAGADGSGIWDQLFAATTAALEDGS